MVVETGQILQQENGTRYIQLPTGFVIRFDWLIMFSDFAMHYMYLFFQCNSLLTSIGNEMVQWQLWTWLTKIILLPKTMLEKYTAFVLAFLMSTLPATCKNKDRQHLIHPQWTIWGGFWSMLVFLGTYIHYHCCAMRLCLHHNRYNYFISAHHTSLDIFCVAPLWFFFSLQIE